MSKSLRNWRQQIQRDSLMMWKDTANVGLPIPTFPLGGAFSRISLFSFSICKFKACEIETPLRRAEMVTLPLIIENDSNENQTEKRQESSGVFTNQEDY